MASGNKNMSRRGLLSLAGGVAGILATKTAAASALVDRESAASKTSETKTERPRGPVMREFRAREASEAALSLLPGIRPGVIVGSMKVAAIHDFHLGAVPVIIEDSFGQRFQVDVLARDEREGAAKGLVETRHLSLFLSNSGHGQTPSDERLGLAVMALAAAISRNEAFTRPQGLLTLAERAVQYPGAGYRLPV